MLGWIREVIKNFLLVYIIYVFIGAVLIFSIPKKVSPEYLEESSHETYYSDQVGRDRAIILDNPLEAGLARLFIIGFNKVNWRFACKTYCPVIYF